jgi:hypothetical protein
MLHYPFFWKYSYELWKAKLCMSSLRISTTIIIWHSALTTHGTKRPWLTIADMEGQQHSCRQGLSEVRLGLDLPHGRVIDAGFIAIYWFGRVVCISSYQTGSGKMSGDENYLFLFSDTAASTLVMGLRTVQKREDSSARMLLRDTNRNQSGSWPIFADPRGV